MNLREKYADKIAKLLAKAESTKSSEEAEMLFAKAQELMSQYSIDEAMLNASRAAGQRGDAVTAEEFVTVGIYRFPLSELCHRVLLLNDIKVVQYGGKNPRTIDGRLFKETVVFQGVGFKSDLGRARNLNTSLMLQAIRSENAWWKENKERYAHLSSKEQHYERRQFLYSFSFSVHEKMVAAKERGQAAAEKEHTSNSVALVLRDKSQMVLDKFNELYPNLRKSKGSSVRGGSYAAHEAGTKAGQRADIGQTGVGGSRKALR
jgi:hypothetical protein